MPDPERLLLTLRRAEQAFRATPGRRGRVIYLEAVGDLLVAGDMHGNLENFRQVLKLADLARNPSRHLVLQEAIHGGFTYPDGSDKSHQLLDLIAALKVQFPRQVHFLLGNHELAQAMGRLIGKGDADLNRLFSDGVSHAYGPRADDIYANYLRLLAVVPLLVRTANRVLVSHSLPPASRLASFDAARLESDEPTEDDLMPGGTVHSLVWGRDTRADHVASYLRLMDADLLITGHIPCEAGFAAPNDRQVILDCILTPAACCLIPLDRPLSHADLLGCVKML